jgi:hypothetical protein
MQIPKEYFSSSACTPLVKRYSLLVPAIWVLRTRQMERQFLSANTITLLMTRPNIDRLVISETLMTLGREIGETFLKIQLALEKSDQEMRDR